MIISVLKSKIHRATVTDAQIHYTGSITIDKTLIEHAKIIPFEKVMVVSLDSGERIETYVIEGKKGSGEVCINGAAARKILKGDKIIIMSFASINESEAENFKPTIVLVNENNRISGQESKAERNDEC
ncbi:MAG: aspartate 1-decarboxylase [Actinobacteria bacterium]|nr:aspartate 1-decarboxylase [Actinomycetota bacterium]